MSEPVLDYRHQGKANRRRPVLGVVSFALSVVGAALLCLPAFNFYLALKVLSATGGAELGVFAVGAGIGVGGLIRRESSGFPIAGICLHLLCVVIWLGMGGWTYFVAGP